MTPATPQLSVVIASYDAEKTIKTCLDSLENQTTDKDFEIIVVDSSIDSTALLIEINFPSVRLYKFPERKFCGDARNWGISVATGEIIAFIDADCVAGNNWVDKLLTAHQSSHPAIGGAIANGNPDSLVGWAAYFCEFSRWMPNTPSARMTDIAGANMSYKRKVFSDLGKFIEGTYCSDTDFHWRLQQMGHYPQFEPSIMIFHYNIDAFLKFVLHEFDHGKNFAQVRVSGKKFSKLRRALYATLFFLIPLKLLLEIGLCNGRNSIYGIYFVKSLPLLIPGLISCNKSRGALSLENFKTLIDEVGDYLLFLHFWGWGESFLNKDFFFIHSPAMAPSSEDNTGARDIPFNSNNLYTERTIQDK